MWRQQYQLLWRVIPEGHWVPYKQVVGISEDRPFAGDIKVGCPVLKSRTFCSGLLYMECCCLLLSRLQVPGEEGKEPQV